MSTVPGTDAWRDAGLLQPEEGPIDLAEEAERKRTAAGPDRDAYRPDTARADLRGEADEADVVEQAAAVPTDEEEYA